MIEPDLFAALETAARRFEAIVAFGDPFDISEEPESFGGTDDGLETVCMAYENMQGIAERGLAEVRAALRDRDAMQARKAGGFEPRRGRSTFTGERDG